MNQIHDALQRTQSPREPGTVHMPPSVRRRSSTAEIEAVKTPSCDNPAAYQRILQGVQGMEQATGRILVVTSAVPGEGTSHVARNLAACLVDNLGKTTVLVDANLRHPSQHEALGMMRGRGLSSLAEPTTTVGEVVRWNNSARFGLVTCGKSGHSSARLLTPERLATITTSLRGLADWIVIDAPPVTLCPETGYLAQASDAVMLVVRAERTRWTVVREAERRLTDAGGNLVGSVLNRRRYHIPQWLYRRL